mmetsp:Transcript_4445/g.8016  ORF Transcript_4445/g.8016 Transcript_4445/m.8016 type:complete len:98 (+) Transcript_4445:103-396(+)
MVRSVAPATMPRSWVMRTTAVPKSSRMSARRSMICACTVTSSAVVGSSAIRILGRQSSDMAIMMRCRIPPENSWGYIRRRLFASEIRTASSIRAASS